jgi:hypothetical protein
MTGESISSSDSSPEEAVSERQRGQEEFFLEHLDALDLVVGWQRGGVHVRGCPQTTYLLAEHSPACDKLQPYVHLLSDQQLAALPVSGSEYASNSASEY